MNILESFNAWLTSIRPDIDHIATLLSTEISNEPEALIEDLTCVEAWNGRCSEMLAQANSFLDRAKRYYLPDRVEGMTERDRVVTLDDCVADIRKFRDTIEGLCNAIKQRLILGESCLAYHRAFIIKNEKTQS